MTKPRLGKVRALLYVLQHVTKRGCAYFDTAPFVLYLSCVSVTIAQGPPSSPCLSWGRTEKLNLVAPMVMRKRESR